MAQRGVKYFTKNVSIAIGIILIWRGVWVLLDLVDQQLFGGSHVITALLGIVVGVLILYHPEKNLKALERL